MPCMRPDGSLTESAKALLAAVKSPHTPEEISSMLGQPLFKIRSGLREMAGAGLVRQDEEKFIATGKGPQGS